MKNGVTRTIVNLSEFLPGDFTRNADFSLPTERLKRAITAAAGREQTRFIDATRLATALLGNSIGANIFMVGYAYQLGAIPLSAESIEEAIELNGEAVAMNQAAFRWGRRAAVDLASVEAQVKPAAEVREQRRLSETLDETIARRVGVPHRVSEPALRQEIPGDGREGAQGRGGGAARRRPRSPTRSRATCSS